MRTAVASDHRGFRTKTRILSQLAALQHEVRDFGTFTAETCDYPDFAASAALAVSDREVDRAIVIGGTGIGMSIVANKFKGVRAALCIDEGSAEMSRVHNDANVLCLSGDLLGEQLASRMIGIWLNTSERTVKHRSRA